MALKTFAPKLRPFGTWKLTLPPKQADPIYSTPEWKALVARLIKQRGRKCEKCGRSHDEHGQPVRIFADHIVELKDGGALLNPRNIQLLDGACHTKKTTEERAKRKGISYI